MNAAELVKSYLQEWSAGNGSGVAGLFATTGTYQDPTTRMAVGPYDLATVVAAFVTPFSNPVFEIHSVVSDGSRACVEWTFRGVNDAAPFRAEVEASGRSVHLSGMDSLALEDGKIVKATRVFDQRSFAEQLGFQVLVEPRDAGPYSFGYSIRASSGNPNPPGIIALTWIRGRDESERDRIRGHSRKIIKDFLDQPGFIGIATGFAGDRGFTVSAWENEEALHQALDKQHSKAKRDFRTGDLSPGVWTSVWQPVRLNRIWTRCPSCQQPNDVTDNHRSCSNCGAELPPRATYW